MFFTIDRKLFSQSEVDILNLNKVWNVCIEQHTFYLSDFDELEAIEASDWYKNLSDSDKKLWEENFVKSVQMGDKSDKIKVSIGDTHTAFEAFQYLSSPLKIILENSQNDAHFINAIFRCFRKESKTIVKHIENRWIQFCMGGGSSIEQTVQSDMDSFNSDRFTKKSEEYLRCFVLLDSDKEHSAAPLKKSTNDLVKFLNGIGVTYHVLEKREMENYIPDIALDKVKNNRPFIEAYLRLSEDQKDYFDLEKGFPPDKNFNSLSTDLQNLYSTVDENDRVIFRQYDMKKFTSSGREDFKKEFPKLFSSECVDKTSLLARTSHQHNPNELKDIIQKIRDLL